MAISPANLPTLPGNYVFFEYQIAGHHHSKSGKYEQLGLLMNKTTSRVLKPLQIQSKEGETEIRGEIEYKFYKLVWGMETDINVDITILKELRKFVPMFYGIITVLVNERPFDFLELENLCGKFNKPCITDIKVGQKTRDPSSTRGSAVPDNRKYEFAANFGFRFSGFMLYDANSNEYKKHDKEWATNMVKQKGVMTMLSIFFKKDQNLPKIIVTTVVDRLKELREFFQRQREVAFYGSSILICYEGTVGSSDVDIRMIDFSHTKFVKSEDTNYLFGLSNLIIQLEQYAGLL